MGFDDDDDDDDDDVGDVGDTSPQQNGAPASPSTNEVKLPPSGFQEKEEEKIVMFTDNGEVDPVEEEKDRNGTKTRGRFCMELYRRYTVKKTIANSRLIFANG